MNDKIKTRRGTFRFAFENMKDAEVAGFSLWFTTDNGTHIVTDGIQVVAVKTMDDDE